MPLYLDHAATTRPDEAVIAAVAACMRDCYANPSSPYQAAGAARREQRLCRAALANLLGCDPTQVAFTSGGTEGNNWVLRNAAGKRVALSAIEHASILNAARLWGCEVTLIPPDAKGVVRPEAVEAALRPDTALICVQAANNETGVLQPIDAIGRVARARGISFHVDAVQAFGHVPVSAAACDTLTLSAHKLYGPRGVGALYIRDGRALAPLLGGGSQEAGRRAGTENTPGICGLRVAAELAWADMTRRAQRERALLADFAARVCGAVPGAFVLGADAERLPGVMALCLPGLESEQAVARLDLMGIQVSGGAACASREGGASHVYRAMGLPDALARCVLRVSVGRHTPPLEEAARAVADVWRRYAKHG